MTNSLLRTGHPLLPGEEPPEPIINTADVMVHEAALRQLGHITVANGRWVRRDPFPIKAEDGSQRLVPIEPTAASVNPQRAEFERAVLEILGPRLDRLEKEIGIR